MSDSSTRLEFHRDPATFLVAAEAHLAADPVVNTVVASIAHRVAAQQAEGIPQPERNWWLVVRDESGAVCGAGMRTAPFAPYPLFLLRMPDEAAVSVARTLHDRGEEALGVAGTLPASELCAGELARLYAGHVNVAQHLRLHELTELTRPAPVPGRLVSATEDDLDLVMDWLVAFSGDADEQAGRPRGASADATPSRGEMIRLIQAGLLWFWVDAAGQPVHMTAANPPSFGVARIFPVYTPPDQRGHGWASNAVAEISHRFQAAGLRVCLFTDQANPTSNKIYTALGYRPVVDVADLVIVR